jgi:ABC-type dipeptide/oligopeptide/nickel transport system permease component
MALARYIAGRLAQGIVVLIGAMIVSFWLAHLTGNPAEVLAGTSLPPEEVQRLAERLGYGDPLLQQFKDYMAGALHGDFGTSYRANEPALDAVLSRLPATLGLIVGAMILSCLIAIPTAVYSVLHREQRTDRAIRRGLTVMQGMPEFWSGLLLVLIFSVSLQWVPSLHNGEPTAWILPIITLALPLSATLVRVLRADLLDVMQADFVVALRAKGLGERAIVLRHGLRNALIPFIGLLALQVGWLFGGTIIVESVFVWNGIGTLLLTSVDTRDIAVVQTIVVLIAAAYVLLNLLADLLAVAIDPRLRAGLTESR